MGETKAARRRATISEASHEASCYFTSSIGLQIVFPWPKKEFKTLIRSEKLPLWADRLFSHRQEGAGDV
jgi:hypothetical protein